MRSDELNFHLPPELIAQTPAIERSASRLMHYRRTDRAISHRTFHDLPKLLRRGDLLVLNDARVIPARFTLIKPTGGRIEGLFIAETKPGHWQVMLKNLGEPSPELVLQFDGADVRARVLRKSAETYELAIEPAVGAMQLLRQIGRMPLPPYIRRNKHRDDRDAMDQSRYQTTFAKALTAIAAPTAALHFTPELFAELASNGVEQTHVTLAVGIGTFKPLAAETLDEHRMHSEWYEISPAAAEALNAAKQDGRRVIAVGTTSTRVLESQLAGQPFVACKGETSIFIRPPYQWKHVSALITNFHLPRSTLIALVAALTGLEEQRRIYSTAIAEKYRFFSYGDAMLIE